MSKREAASSSDGRSFFETSLESFGFVFTRPESKFHLCKQPGSIGLNLDRALLDDFKATKSFLEEFERHMEDDGNLHKSLRNTYEKEGNEFEMERHQSLVRLLLGVNTLQPQILEYLLEKLPECSSPEDSQLACQIVNQLRWLDHVVDGKELSSKLIEVAAVCSPLLQRHLIAAIPDIIDDAGHDIMIAFLVDLMNETPDLTVTILDAFSNLTIKGDTASKVSASVLDNMSSTRIEDLPVVIRFILQTTTQKGLQNTVSVLRKNLNFFGTSQSRKSAKQDSLLIFDALKNSIRFQRPVAASFLKEISKITVAVEFKILDLWILLMIHSLSSHKKQVESILKKKINAGLFSLKFFKNAFQQRLSIIKDLSASILNIAGNLVRADSMILRNAGGQFYSGLFLSCDTIYIKQDVIGNLITHIGSGIDDEVNVSLRELQRICEADSTSMQPMVAFVRGILDYLSGFSRPQLRNVYSIFSIIATCDAGKSSNFGTELMINIKKQLSTPRYQEIGVIGGVSLLSRLVDKTKKVVQDKAKETEISQLLEDIFSCTSESSDLRIFLADEISSYILKGNLSPYIIERVIDKIADTFQEDFLVEPKAFESDDSSPWMGLDGEDGIELLLWPLLASDKETDNSKVFCMASIFRLLQVGEGASNDGSRAGLDALLGAKLILFDEELNDISDMGREKQELICSCVFYAIQWMRELLNAFCGEGDKASRRKVCQRVYHILNLEKALGSLMRQMPTASTFVPMGVSAAQAREAVAIIKPKGKKASKKKDIQNDDTSFLASLKPYYRTILESAFQILELPLEISAASESDTKMMEIKSEEPKLDPTTLNYFIGELELLLKPSFRRERKFGFFGDKKKPNKSKSAAQPPEILLSSISPIFEHVGRHLNEIADTLLNADQANKSLMDNKDLQAIVMSVIRCSKMILDSAEGGLDSEPAFWHALHRLTSCVAPTENDSKRGKGKKRDSMEILPDPDAKMQIATQVFKFLEKQLGALSRFQEKVIAIEVMEKALAISPEKLTACRSRLSQLACELLQTKWDSDSKLNSSTISRSVRVFITYAKSPLDALEELVSTAMLEMPAAKRRKRKKKKQKRKSKKKKSRANKENEDGNDETEEDDDRGDESESDESPFHATLTEKTIPFYFTVTLEKVTQSAGQRLPAAASPGIVCLSRHSHVFRNLMGLCKKFYGKVNLLVSALRSGKVLVDTYVKHMPFLHQNFSQYRDDIIEMIRDIQQGTRIMQMICTHGKRNRLSNLISLVPSSKKVMESFIYHIKKLFKGNNCLGAFWQGNLKHRAMDGTEISQTPPSDEEEEEANGDAEEESECEAQNEREQ